MQGSKRTLRSNEMALPPTGLLDTELQLNFSLQYPHFLKRDGNKLHVMLQRRKRYKNRTILGYKTLAEGVINMSQVLQRQMDLELDLVSDAKSESKSGGATGLGAVARVSVQSLNSQPVDHEDTAKHHQHHTGGRVTDFSDEEEEFSSNEEAEVDGEGEGEGSDSEPAIEDRRTGRKVGKIPTANARQRNLKQKFIALLKRFRVSEDLHGLSADQEVISRKLSGGDMDPADIEDLFDELEDLSDSGPEVDTASISSTPKPSLRPFFSSSRPSLLHAETLPTPQGGIRGPITTATSASGRQQNPAAQNPKTPTGAAAALDGLPLPQRVLPAATAPQQAPITPSLPLGSSHQHQLLFTANPGERGMGIMERLSDESSKKADSDSHPENWTDSDPPPQPSSPPKSALVMEEKKESSGDKEKDKEKEKERSGSRGGRLFNRGDRNSSTSSSTSKSKRDRQSTAGSQQSSTVHVLHSGDSNTTSGEPRKVLLEQLARVLPAEDFVPGELCLVNTGDPLGALLASRLQDRQHKVICTATSADVRATINCLANKIQKFCNSNPKPPAQIRLVLAGSDGFVNCVLRHYVQQLSSKPPDWQAYIRFLVVPLGNNTLCRYLGSLDMAYSAAFASDSWRDVLERGDSAEAASRVQRYVQQQSAGQASVIHLPIAEAMLTCREKSTGEDESSQIFIPFMNDVRLGSPEGSASASVDLEEATSPAAPTSGIHQTLPNTSSSAATTPASTGPSSGSPPAQGEKERKAATPPSSPNMGVTTISSLPTSLFSKSELCEPLELQLDYWLIPQTHATTDSKEGGGGIIGGAVGGVGGLVSGGGVLGSGGGGKVKGDGAKSTLKSAFRSLQIARLSTQGEQPSPHFTISYSTKEKKQKIMRLGKKKEKEKDNEARSQFVEGVSRLICSPRTQNVPLRLCIDGTEWTGVKFFQLSAHWQTHVRYFPVALFTGHDSTQL